MLNKFAIGALIAIAAVAAVWGYGRYENKQGWAERDTQAKLDLAARQTALYNEQTRLENERIANDEYVQKLKADTVAHTADLDDLVGRLRVQLTLARNKHPGTAALGRANGVDPDWIGIVATCWSDYAELGKEAATYADRVNGLQDYARRLRPPK